MKCVIALCKPEQESGTSNSQGTPAAPAGTPVVSAMVVSAVAVVIHHVRVIGPVVFLLVPVRCLPIKLSGQSIRSISTELSMVSPPA